MEPGDQSPSASKKRPNPYQFSGDDASDVCRACGDYHCRGFCPRYPCNEPRISHPDGQQDAYQSRDAVNKKVLPGEMLTLGQDVIKRRQPPDGNCLFHSLLYLWNLLHRTDFTYPDVATLRSKLCAHMKKHCDEVLFDHHHNSHSLKESIECEQIPFRDYMARMQQDGWWGSAREIASFVHMVGGVNVHVYQCENTPGLKRIWSFDAVSNHEECPIMRLLFSGGTHYDALTTPSASASASAALPSTALPSAALPSAPAPASPHLTMAALAEVAFNKGFVHDETADGLQWIPGIRYDVPVFLFRDGEQLVTYKQVGSKVENWTLADCGCLREAIKEVLQQHRDGAMFVTNEKVTQEFKQLVYDEFMEKDKYG